MSPSLNRVSGGRETGRRADATAVGRSPCSPHDRSRPLLREMWPAGAVVVRYACRRRRFREVDALPVRARADSERRRRTPTAANRFLDDPPSTASPAWWCSGASRHASGRRADARPHPVQGRRAFTIQARESNQTPSVLACAASVSWRRPSARSADALSRRASTSFVHVKPRIHSSPAATSRPK